MLITYVAELVDACGLKPHPFGYRFDSDHGYFLNYLKFYRVKWMPKVLKNTLIYKRYPFCKFFFDFYIYLK